jgi:hypothetical protein
MQATRNKTLNILLKMRVIDWSETTMSSTAATTVTKPLHRLALHSTTTCAAKASAYGQCILATYTDVKKDGCKEEFEQFGRCLRTAVRLSIKICKIPYLTWIFRWSASGDTHVWEDGAASEICFNLTNTRTSEKKSKGWFVENELNLTTWIDNHPAFLLFS